VELVPRIVEREPGVRATTLTGQNAENPRAEDVRRTSIDAVADAASAQDWRSAPVPDDGGTVTIVFSDIESSTELASSLGDNAWYEVLEEHNRVVREQLRRFGGFEVKAQGDGFMLTFTGARRAVQFAIAAQRALTSTGDAGRGAGVRIRIGMHTGEAIVDRSGDLFGQHVNVAARVANAATGGEILVSRLVHEIVGSRGDVPFGPARHVTLKGLVGEQIVYPVQWRPSETPVENSS
jgi:class 3 adenylate cyclase